MEQRLSSDRVHRRLLMAHGLAMRPAAATLALLLCCLHQLALSQAPRCGGTLSQAQPAGHLRLRGGAKEGRASRKSHDLASSSSRVTFGKSKRARPGKESEPDESWQDHSRSLGAPDGKHTPGKPAKAKSRRKKRRSVAAAGPGDEDSTGGEESSLRFARLGAPDGKHTPAAPRSGSASRWSDLLDSSTEAPARSGSPGQSDMAASRVQSKASDTHPSSRRVLFSMDDEPARAQPRTRAPGTPVVAAPDKKLEKPKSRRPRKLQPPSSSPGKEDDRDEDIEDMQSEQELDIDEGSASQGEKSSIDQRVDSEDSDPAGRRKSESEDDEMQEDSDYQEVMRLRRGKDKNGEGTANAKACGVGMLLECDALGHYRVTRLAQGGSASEHGGVLVGDAIDRVDKIPLRGMSLEEVAKSICGPAGTYVTLHLLRGKKQMPASVRLRRRPLHKTASSPARPPRASLDSRIADLVADMSYEEVEDMVAELEKEEERQKVWEVWKSIHAPQDEDSPSSEGDLDDEQSHSRRTEVDQDEPDTPDLVQTMRVHNKQVDSLLKGEELRLERRAAKARKQAELQEKVALENAYRGAKAVHKSAGARRAGFRQRVKVDTPSKDLDVIKELERLNEADKLKGNTFGARGSKRSGSKDSKVEGVRASMLKGNRKFKLDFGGL